eukprot:NODE_6017_length_663_cov_1.218284_g5994_i0.p1 GENE.NODE_6017_length_663_cov_1.218284_g5994_i0~~NODE_6017_length_663_cov_1.218284_g5994_i0.p1  ORF type:complete len:158 (+),score=18.07 NODE_6017_length_663_cov_1.218284_g5994_i0:165-638(+)
MRRINTQNPDLVRKELKFFKRMAQTKLFWMGFDLGKELGCGEMSLDHIAFKLGHVDPIGSKTAKRLVKGRRNVTDAEDKACHYRRAVIGDIKRLARQNDETGRIMCRIFDLGAQHIKAINLCCQNRGNRSNALSPRSATSFAQPAVSGPTTVFTPSS